MNVTFANGMGTTWGVVWRVLSADILSALKAANLLLWIEQEDVTLLQPKSPAVIPIIELIFQAFNKLSIFRD